MSNLCRELKVKARRCIMYLSFAHAYVVCPFPKAASVEKAFPDVGERVERVIWCQTQSNLVIGHFS